MKRKQVLFAMNHLGCGGAEKALLSLLEILDYTRYDVDLFLFKHEGLFMSKIPPQVNLLSEPPLFKCFDMPAKKALLRSVRSGRIDIAGSRVLAGFINKTEKNKARNDQRIWKYVSASVPSLGKKYDIAVGYLEMAPTYFVVDKVQAKKKIGWIHTNYSNSGMDHRLDQYYFEKLDHVVTVSQECEKPLKALFPFANDKIHVIGNIVSPSVIKKLSQEQVSEHDFNNADGSITILTIARLCHVKGIDLAIEACRMLVDRGVNVKWHVLGTGTEKENFEYNQMIQDYGLEEHFKLAGVKENPYPYLSKAHIYVQPSRFEGRSIAIEEAKILGKPIVVTNFSTVKEQITDDETGVIVEVNAASLASGILEVIENDNLKVKLRMKLAAEALGSEDEIYKVYTLFNRGTVHC